MYTKVIYAEACAFFCLVGRSQQTGLTIV